MKKRKSLITAILLVLTLAAAFALGIEAEEKPYVDAVKEYVEGNEGSLFSAVDFTQSSSTGYFYATYGENLVINNKAGAVENEKGSFAADLTANRYLYYTLNNGFSPAKSTENLVFELEFTYNEALTSNAAGFFHLRFKDSTATTVLSQNLITLTRAGDSETLRTYMGRKKIISTCEVGKTYNLAFSVDITRNKVYCFLDGNYVCEDAFADDTAFASLSAEDVYLERLTLAQTGKNASGKFLFDNVALYTAGNIPARYAPYCMEEEYKAVLENEELLAEQARFEAEKAAIINAVGAENVIFISDFTDVTTPSRVYVGSNADGYSAAGKTNLYYTNAANYAEATGEFHYYTVGNTAAPASYMYLQNRGYQATNAEGGVTASPEGMPFVFQFDIKWRESTSALNFAFFGTNDDGVTRSNYSLVTVDTSGYVQVNAQKIAKLSADKYSRITIFVNPLDPCYSVYIDGELKITRSLINATDGNYIHKEFRLWEARFLNTKANTQSDFYIDKIVSYYTTPEIGYVGELEKSADTGSRFTSDYNYPIKAPLSALPLTVEATVKLDADMDPSVNAGYIMSGERYGYTFSAGITKNLKPTFIWTTELTFDAVTVPLGEVFDLAYTVNLDTRTVDCYLNGSLAQSITVENTKLYPIAKLDLSKLAIGGSFDLSNPYFFKGEIIEIALYSDIRTADEILADSTEIVHAAEGMIAHYKPTTGADVFVELMGSGADAVKTDETFWLDTVPEVPNDYTFVVVGDTQTMTQYHPDALSEMYQWIVDNAEREKIKFVMGLGDIIDSDASKVPEQAELEWQIAKAAIGLMNGKVPYSILPGNHDYYAGNNRELTLYNQYFPVAELEAANPNTFGGAYEAGKSENTYHTVEVNGNKYMIFALEYGPRDGVLLWMENLIAANPDHTVIITTHSYHNPDGSLVTAEDFLDPKEKFYKDDETGANNADEIWEEVLRKYSNVRMVFSGHHTNDNLRTLYQKGDNGNTVTNILCDPQGPMADTAMLMLLRFSEDGTRVNVEWYSATRNQYYRAENQFAFEVYSEAPETDVDIYGRSITLGGEIGVNFYMELSDELAANKNAYMLFTLPNGRTNRVYIKDAEKRNVGGKEYYMFTCRVDATEMSEEIRAKLIVGERVSETYLYSVKAYAENVIAANTESPEVIALVKSLVNYGARAQLHFVRNTENLANEALPEGEKAVATLDGIDFSTYDRVETGSVSGITYYGTSTVLNANTVLRHYFTLDAGADIASYSFTVGEKSLSPQYKDGYYYVDISDIAAPNLGYMYQLDVTNGTESFAVKYSVYTYIASVNANDSYPESVKETVRAAYYYSLAAIEYIESTNG